MKATLAMIACLAMAGFLTAATVEGNNTAVVIQKDKVESKTGWQLLCVPVTPLKINGAASPETKISIDSILPPESYPADAQVFVDGSPFATLSSSSGTKAWVSPSTAKSSSDLTLAPGKVFWLKKPTGNENQMPDATTFCGQEKTAAERTRPANGTMVLMQNDSDQPLKISEVMGTNAKNLDEILRIKAGSLDYYSFTYFTSENDQSGKSGWYDAPAGYTSANDVKIAPGEAFYYYASSGE